MTATKPKGTLRQDLALGLYCSSIIMGAGLLQLPNLAAQLGAGPVLVTTVVMGICMAVVYSRLAGSLFDYVQNAARDQALQEPGLNQELWIRDQVQKSGSRLLTEMLKKNFKGSAGRVAMLLGMFFYVFFGDIAYIAVGFHSLKAIAAALDTSGWTSTAIFAEVGFTLIVGAQFVQCLPARFADLYGTLKKICVMSGTWCFGIAALLALEFMPGKNAQISTAVGLVVFTIAVLAGMFTTVPAADGSEDLVPTAQHRVNIIMVLVTLGLLALAAVGALFFAIRHGLFVDVTLLSVDAFKLDRPEIPNAWRDMVGVVLFALVGTGLLNLTVYPSLFGKAQGKKRITRLDGVVMIGTFIPVLVYVAWVAVTVVLLPSSTLAGLVQTKDYSTIGLARLFGQVSPLAGAWVAVFGYSVALLAVTSACNGFTESLADQAAIWIEESGRLRALTASKDNLAMRVAILVAAMLVAFGFEQLQNVNLSTLLSVAGYAGGGLLLLILPFFLPARGQLKSGWGSILIASCFTAGLMVLIVTGIDFSQMNDLGSMIVTTVSTVTASSIVVMVLWMARSEPDLTRPSDSADLLHADFTTLEKPPVVTGELGRETAMK